MALRALRVWRDFDNCVGGNPGWVHTGALFIVGRNDVDGLKANIALQKSVGINTEFVDVKAVHEIAPYLQVDDIGGAAYEPESGYADGSMAATAYADRAKALGAVIRQGVEVTAITIESGRVTGVDTNQGHISASVVVNAGGAWGVKLARALGYETPIEPSRHQISVFQQPTAMPAPKHVIVADFIQQFYMRPETGGLTLAGSLEDSESSVTVDPDSYVETVDMDFNAEMADRTEHRLPVMGEARVAKGWAGLYDVSADWHPIIGRLPGVEGLVCAYGFSGSGFKMGPVVGEMVADLATGEQRCPIDPRPFRYERFAENDLIRMQYGYGVIG
jgi:glycine/D-amino acid oxidase-like deaminating enzyme